MNQHREPISPDLDSLPRPAPMTPLWHATLQATLITARDLLWDKTEEGNYGSRWGLATQIIRATDHIRKALDIAYEISQLPLPLDKEPTP